MYNNIRAEKAGCKLKQASKFPRSV